MSFCCFLEGQYRSGLETKVCLEVLGNFTNETLEGGLADEKLGGLLIFTDLTEGNGTGAVTVGLLHTSVCRGGLASGLGGELLAWDLSSGGSTGGLLGTGHLCCWCWCFLLLLVLFSVGVGVGVVFVIYFATM